MSILEIIAVAVIGYLLGSISFAQIIARRHGVDILKAGSGNPGATNVKRVLGKRAGNLCFALDFLKGCVASGIPLLPFLGAREPELLGLIALAAAILGHSFSVFLKFKGGKGVAVTMGGLAMLMFSVVLIGAALWCLVFFTTRYVSLASIVFGVSLPISAGFLGFGASQVTFALILAILIVLRHRSNIQRLLRGEENRFNKRQKP